MFRKKTKSSVYDNPLCSNKKAFYLFLLNGNNMIPLDNRNKMKLIINKCRKCKEDVTT